MKLSELLKTGEFKYNKSLLSRELGVNRKTVDKYLKDINGDNHYAKQIDGEWYLFAMVGDK